MQHVSNVLIASSVAVTALAEDPVPVTHPPEYIQKEPDGWPSRTVPSVGVALRWVLSCNGILIQERLSGATAQVLAAVDRKGVPLRPRQSPLQPTEAGTCRGCGTGLRCAAGSVMYARSQIINIRVAGAPIEHHAQFAT